MNRLRMFFSSTPEGRKQRRRALPYALFGAALVFVLLAIPPAWEYTNSTQFCGETCHTMPPEYQTYLVSPHARVPCVDCHIGRGLLIEQAIRKTGHMRLVWATLTNSYEYPIMVSSMRPARDTCELCHFPEKFSDDSLRQINHTRENVDNTPYSIYLLMHTGGGTSREGLGYGIHWHTENQIEYIATDRLDQTIPWIRVTAPDGTQTEYATTDPEFDPAALNQAEIREMDCMTCHNRISHLIESPRTLVEGALSRGDIPRDIPNILYVAERAMAAPYKTTEEAHEGLAAIETYYQENYPDFISQNEGTLTQTIAQLRELWDANNYVEQELNWQTHPDNIGHKDWPGCFRCHDGRHVSAAGAVVRLECNLCHAIPQVVRPTDIEPMLPLTTGLEPESHLDSTWISRHHNEFDRSCANCHTVENPGGTSDTSFCSNSACHGEEWRFAGFDAPALALEMGLIQQTTGGEEGPAALPETLTYQEIRPILVAECGECHGENPTAGLKVTDYASLMIGGRDGAVIVPGDPEASPIFAVLDQRHFGALTSVQLALVRQWVLAGALEGAPAGPAASAAPTYETVGPALTETCGRCHGGDRPRSGLDVTSYATLLAGGRDGAVITPGDPDDSLIFEVLAEGHFAELSADQMQMLRDWVAAGAPEAAGSAASAEPAASSGEPTYADLQPILTETCGECHSGDRPRSGLDVTSYATLLAGGRDGAVIIPGDPDDSLIFEVLGEGHRAELSPDQMQMLRAWVAAGAPEAAGSAAPAEPAASSGEPTYADLQPILTETCGECHSGDRPRSGLDVTSYATLLAGGRDGAVIIPGNPDDSLIFEVLGEGHRAELSPDQMQMLRAWVAAGAPEAAGSAAPAEPAASSGEPTYADLQPILTETCGECHSGDRPRSGLDVTSYATLLAGGRDGAVIIPGDPDDSLIFEVLGEGHRAELSPDQMQMLRAWVAAGAPE